MTASEVRLSGLQRSLPSPTTLWHTPQKREKATDVLSVLSSTRGVCDCTVCSVFYEQPLPFHFKFHWESSGICRCTAWHWDQSISEQFFASEKYCITSLFAVGCRVFES